MGVKELLSMDWESVRGLGRKELGKIITQLSSAANKRVRRFAEKGEISPAVRYAEKGGAFTGRGKNLNQLRSEYVRIKSFMQQETSSLRSWGKVKRETVNTLSDMGVNIPKEDIGEVMRIYGKVKDEFPDLTDSAIYAPAIQQIYDQMQSGRDTADIINDARSMMVQGYENRERANYGFNTGGVSEFF